MPLLSPEAQAKVQAFAEVKVKHPRLEEADRAVTHAIAAHAGYTHLLLYGPSGVGKSTMMARITERFRAEEPNGLVVPVVLVEARTPDSGTYTRLDYYRQVLTALKEHVLVKELLVNVTLTPATKPTRAARNVAEWLDLREAVEQALARLQVKAVVIDEAQHLMQVQPPLKPVDQLDWLKSMTNRTQVLHVLVGPFDLFDFRNLNGQAARRGREIYFPRYHVEPLTERQEFVGALRYLLERVPLTCDVADLLSRWRWMAESSLGCVGILRDWLLETVAATLGKGGTTLTAEALGHHTLHPAKRLQLETEMRAGERRVEGGNASSLQAWHTLLSTPAAAPSSPSPALGATPASSGPPPHVRHDGITPPANIPPAASARPGQRAPQRDPVGDSLPEEQPSRCTFAGPLDLEPARPVETAVTKVECPECGALRTLHPHGNTLHFPPHPKRRTRPPRGEVRWVRRGAMWELSGQQV
jgi:DNA polymerase III delta prime subunit